MHNNGMDDTWLLSSPSLIVMISNARYDWDTNISATCPLPHWLFLGGGERTIEINILVLLYHLFYITKHYQGRREEETITWFATYHHSSPSIHI